LKKKKYKAINNQIKMLDKATRVRKILDAVAATAKKIGKRFPLYGTSLQDCCDVITCLYPHYDILFLVGP
jgi:hypothetical protein